MAAAAAKTGGGRLAGTIALVTGGGNGIGRAVCQTFAREGAAVAVVDVNQPAAQETLESLPAVPHGPHQLYTTDVSSSVAVNKLVTDICSDYATPPNIVVTSAGILRYAPFLEVDEQHFDDVIGVNLKGTFLVAQAFARLMVERKLQNCSICTFSSFSRRLGTANRSPYNTTKGAVMALTKSMAVELAQYNIRCNTVVPGSISTEMVRKNRTPEELQQRIQAIPLQRVGEPEGNFLLIIHVIISSYHITAPSPNPTAGHLVEVANLVLFLSSSEGSYMTGQAVEITGGL
ncbi:estradiol 17-beta-dehydrogenase 8-like [Branchiostoma floridae]|uniref:Estradiol 17-beta-dehydrogenase 8-like n=1 Tax=Branchiostoma floridae TaxID=7739 RepID=A0A9J7LM35_BRAFL|nr:estradiol 17-beta-dehydrogenase 8-like [Branchiostoma floridae]